MGLAQALQWCAVESGAPPEVLCKAIQDLCRCLVPLMERGNLLHLSILEVMEEEAMTTSPSPAKETGYLDEEPEPQEE